MPNYIAQIRERSVADGSLRKMKKLLKSIQKYLFQGVSKQAGLMSCVGRHGLPCVVPDGVASAVAVVTVVLAGVTYVDILFSFVCWETFCYHVYR